MGLLQHLHHSFLRDMSFPMDTACRGRPSTDAENNGNYATCSSIKAGKLGNQVLIREPSPLLLGLELTPLRTQRLCQDQRLAAALHIFPFPSSAFGRPRDHS